MNDAIAAVRANQERAAAGGAATIGYVVNYDAEQISISRRDLKDIFESEGFSGFVPEEMDPVAALARAKGRPLPRGIKVDMFVRPNAGTPVSYGIYRKVGVDGEKGDSFLCGARVRVNKSSGTIVALPPDGEQAHPECLEVANAIAADANKLITFAETVDVTTAAKDVVMGALHGMAMRSRGGLYFVRPDAGDRWRKLAAKLEIHGFIDLGFPMHAGVAAQKAAQHSVKTGLEAKLAEIRDRITEFSAKTRDSNVKGKIEDCERIASEAELYAEILGDWKASLLAQVADAKQKCQRKLAGDDADFTFASDPEPVVSPPAVKAAPAAAPVVAEPGTAKETANAGGWGAWGSFSA